MTDLLVRLPSAPGVPPHRVREPFWRRPVLQFTAALLTVMVLLSVGTFVLARRAALNEAIRDARTSTELLAHAVVTPGLPRGLVSGDPAALAAFDRLVRQRVLSGWLSGSRSGLRTGRCSTPTSPG